MICDKYPDPGLGIYVHPNIELLANILDKNGISYLYQPGLLVLGIDGEVEERIPTLYLPKYQTVIERFTSLDYSHGAPRIKNMETVFQKNHFNFIPLHPQRQSTPDSPFPTLAHDQYQSYVFSSIKSFLEERLREFNKITGTK